MSQVKSLIDIQTTSPALPGELDPWAAFREVERITLELTQQYKHSLGKYSRFFIELENKRFMATTCSSCHKTYAPPRPLCPDCLAITAWVELPGTGVVKTYSILHYSPGSNPDVDNLTTPYVLAYVLLDGATTLFPHVVRATIDQVTIGMPVQVAYASDDVYHSIHLMYFVPQENV